MIAITALKNLQFRIDDLFLHAVVFKLSAGIPENCLRLKKLNLIDC